MLAGVEEPLSWAVFAPSQNVCQHHSLPKFLVECYVLGTRSRKLSCFLEQETRQLDELACVGSAESQMGSICSQWRILDIWFGGGLVGHWQYVGRAKNQPIHYWHLYPKWLSKIKEVRVSFGVLYCQSMEFLLKPVWVSHLIAKCELELVYKLLTVLQMRLQRKKCHFPLVIHSDLTTSLFFLSFSS